MRFHINLEVLDGCHRVARESRTILVGGVKVSSALNHLESGEWNVNRVRSAVKMDIKASSQLGKD